MKAVLPRINTPVNGYYLLMYNDKRPLKRSIHILTKLSFYNGKIYRVKQVFRKSTFPFKEGGSDDTSNGSTHIVAQ